MSPECEKLTKLFAVKNEYTDAQRVARGLTPAMKQLAKSMGASWDEAMARLHKDPDAGRKVVDAINAHSKTPDDVEVALVAHRLVDVSNAYEGAMHRLAQAKKGGDLTDATAAEKEMRAANDELAKVYDASRLSGTITSRALNIRKMLLREDFSLARIMMQARAAAGRDLTMAEHATILELQKKIADLEARTDQTAAAKPPEDPALVRKAEEATVKLEDKKAELTGQGVAPTEIDRQVRPLQKEMEEARTAAAVSGAGRGDWTQQMENVQGEAADAKVKVRELIRKLQDENRSTWEKVSDLWLKIRRAMVLSSPKTIVKIAAASAQRIGVSSAEEAVGEGLARVPGLSRIAALAPREGRGLSWAVEKQAWAAAFTDGIQDALQILKTGKSNLEREQGATAQKNLPGIVEGHDPNAPREWLDLFGEIHAAFKAPAKRAEYTRSLLNRLNRAAGQGRDITDPNVKLKLVAEAYQDAQRAIFMQQNWLVDAYQSAVHKISQPEMPWQARTAAVVGKTLLPVVRVPTNIVFETLTYATGFATGSVKAGAALMRAGGVKDLKPEQAEAIMRELKKGSLGVAMMLLGYLNPAAIGGYYQPDEKRKKGDVPIGAVRTPLGDIPSFLLHNPLLEVMQFGATLRRASDKVRKGQAQGPLAGLGAATAGLAEEMPLVRETTDVGKLVATPRERGRYFGELLKSLSTPQLMDWLAKNLDKDTKFSPLEEPRKRKPGTVLQHVEMGWPGARELVPQK